ncbi:MAG: class A beta-lactamase-related serine hydrolase [Bacteroidetes bacterium]|nr:class A beta-lactamase-related serine hydrolase [Bacteroidota bacterium]
MAQETLDEVKYNILKEFKKVDGRFALAFWELQPNGQHILINEKENFHAASTMKTPVMIEVFKQSGEGKFNLDDSVIIKNEFKSIVDSSIYSLNFTDDSGENLYQYIDKKKTIKELVYDMITVSSNLATNILIDLVNPKNVMNTMKKFGANDIKIMRGVEDLKAFDLGINNTTTAYDLMIILKKIVDGEAASQNSCSEMINILLDQKLNSIIPAKLPLDVKVAHKTGSISGVVHDSGIIFLPNGKKYILVFLSKNLQNNQLGVEVGAKVSKLIYDYVMQKM